MERLRSTVAKIGATADDRLPNLPLLQRSLFPILSLSSHLYRLFLSLRRLLFLSGLFPRRRLPVPVISVGNLTWGGNGKTPMVEFIARYLEEMGIPPLILSRGYAGGDEAKMLQRHLLQTSAKIGVGANRSATAAAVFERYGYMDLCNPVHSETLLSPQKLGPHLRTEMIGAVILDDGMQHWSLFKNVEVVMINGLAPWGNNRLIPRGSLREPLDALGRAHIGVIHHADMISSTELQTIVSTIQKFNPLLPVFISRMAPLFVFEVKNPLSKIPVTMVLNMAILCVSAIGFPDAFVQGIRKLDVDLVRLWSVYLHSYFQLIWKLVEFQIGPLHVDRLDFSDHHSIKPNDIDLIRKRLKLVENRFCMEAVVLITEKDYDRDPVILEAVDDFQIMVLCSSLEIMPFGDRTGEDFTMNLKKLLLCRCRDAA